MAVYEKLEPLRQELYESEEKVLIDGSPQGTGKTVTAEIYFLNHNKNNISFFNTHELIDEIFRDIYAHRLYGKIKEFPLISPLFGKSYQLNKRQCLLYGYDAPYLCNLYQNEYMFKLMTYGFLSSDYCNKQCIYKHLCKHKSHILDAFNSHKFNYNNMCLSVKAYIHTSIVDGFLNSFDNLVGIFDENIFNLLYTQINIHPYHIDKFRDLIDKIIYKTNNKEIKEFWNDFEDLLSIIREYIKHKKSMKKDKKEIVITNKLIRFLQSNSVKSIIKWNEVFKELFTIYKINFKITNLLNSFIEIFKNMIKIKSGIKIKERLIIDEDDSCLTYYINRKDRIKQIFDELHKVVLTDATVTDVLINNIFPEYKDDYKLFRGSKYKPKYKEVYILRKDQKIGSYHKPVLWNKSKQNITKSFLTLVKKTEFILDKHKREKILLIAFKVFIEPLQQKLKIINRYNINIKFDYYYNIEGKNIYKDRDVVILFGGAGKPRKVKETFTNMFKIDEETLDNLFTQQHMIQGIERTRPILRPNQIICYMLTNACVDYFPDAIGFDKLLRYEYKDLLDFIELQGRISTKAINSIYFKDKKSVEYTNKLLNRLHSFGYLKVETSSKGRGRPSKLWMI